MAVQKTRKSRSKKNMRRSHDALNHPVLSVDKISGETHLRHHISATGYYKGKKLVAIKNNDK